MRVFFRVIWLGLIAAAAVGATLVPASPTRLDLAMVACWLGALWVYTLGRTVGFRVLHNPPASPRASGAGCLVGLVTALAGLLAVVGPLAAAVLIVMDLPPNHREPGTTQVINTSGVTAILGTAAVVAFVHLNRISDAATVATMRLVLRAPLHEHGIPAGAWGRTVGQVRDPTPVAVGTEMAAFAITTDEEHVPGSNPNIVVKGMTNVGTFLVATGRTVIEVDPAGIDWAGPARQQVRGRAASGNSRTITADYVPVGATVMLVGRPQGASYSQSLRLAATTTDPVFLMRLPDGATDPSAGFRRALVRRNVCFALLAALAVATGGLAWTLSLDQPPLHFPPNSSGSD